ncbi:EutN/CcmL family microcompartment protein [bacterium]|nr:EutN/CcmL family microcompartment protein [bacterium]
MLICKVIGNVISTVKNPAYEGRKILLVSILDTEGNPTGETEIAIDLVDAGIGDIMLLSKEGGAARRILEAPDAPVRAFIAGVIDNWEVYSKE